LLGNDLIVSYEDERWMLGVGWKKGDGFMN
jgi:hypothetical protein